MEDLDHTGWRQRLIDRDEERERKEKVKMAKEIEGARLGQLNIGQLAREIYGVGR